MGTVKPVTNSYPRETNVVQWLTVELKGEPVDPAIVTLAAVPGKVRPTSWVAPILDAGHPDQVGIRVQSLAVGHYRVFAKVDSDLEDPVIELDGSFWIT